MRAAIGFLRDLLALAALVGVALHFTVRDSYPIVATVFYALPLPACAGLLFVSALLGIRRTMWAAGCTIAGLVVAAYWLATTYGFHAEEDGDIRIATWNLSNPRHPFQPLIDVVSREHPDFMGLIEVGGLNVEIAKDYAFPLPDYHFSVFPGGIGCLTTGTVKSWSYHPVAGEGRAISLEVDIRGTPIRLVLVDLNSDVFLIRAAEYLALRDIAGTAPRTLLLGDFNTPLESRYSATLRPLFLNSMESAGHGFRETWFFMLPLLSLDQIWSSPDLRPTGSHRVYTKASDHAPVVTDLKFTDPPTKRDR